MNKFRRNLRRNLRWLLFGIEEPKETDHLKEPDIEETKPEKEQFTEEHSADRPKEPTEPIESLEAVKPTEGGNVSMGEIPPPPLKEEGQQPPWAYNWQYPVQPARKRHRSRKKKEIQTAEQAPFDGEINPSPPESGKEADDAPRPAAEDDQSIEGTNNPVEVVPKMGQDLLSQAKNLHQLGIDGDKEAVKQAHELLKKIREEEPENRVAEAYFGSVTSLLGRDAVDPNERFKLAIAGLKILDGVVLAEPDNIEIRTLRAYVSFKLPEIFFHRTVTAIEDFSYLASRFEQDNTSMTPGFYHQVLFDLGCAYKNIERHQDAESTWKKLLSVTSDPKYRELVKEQGVETLPFPLAAEQPGELKEDVESVAAKVDISTGIKLHELALGGDREAARQAFYFFEKAHRHCPGDHLIEAYYADCLSLQGRDAAEPSEMFAKAYKAMKIFDSAVNGDPNNIQVRLLRAQHGLRLPEAFFCRTATALGDLEYVKGRYEQDSSIMPQDLYWQVLYNLSEAYDRLAMYEEAKSTRQLLLDNGGGQKYPALLLDKPENTAPEAVEYSATMSKERLLKEAIRLHDLAVAGNKQASKKAYELFEKLFTADPDDPLIEGYYGSSMALYGRDSMNPSLMFGNAIKGVVHLKKALARDMNNPTLHLLRGYLCYNLPETFFHLTERALKDFRFLKTAYEQDNTIFPAEQYWQILYDLGVAYLRSGDNAKAQKVWKKLVKECPDPKYKALLHMETERGDD